MRLSPVMRITGGIVLLTVGVLLAGNLLGISPDHRDLLLKSRQQYCEALAVQLSLSVQDGNIKLAKQSLDAAVARNPDVLSAAMRRADGSYVIATTDHNSHWRVLDHGLSTLDQVQVPIVSGETLWGAVEISFLQSGITGWRGWLDSPFAKQLLFVMMIGFVVYFLFMKKSLKYLDPSSVIPGRVKVAMDTLVEGVVLMDESERIVLANAAFAKQLGCAPEQLLGRKLSVFHWRDPKTGKKVKRYPWSLAMQTGKSRSGVPMQLMNGDDAYTLMVNGAPILDAKGRAVGTLATFDDVTQLEEKNAQLEKMLALLRQSQDKVHKQNDQLRILATRDSLTGCLNRRALFEILENDFEQVQRDASSLCCIMCDIDHFKEINDARGHAAGDMVIERIAAALSGMIREGDHICRYGGEEFCIILPGLTALQGAETAERLRRKVAALDLNGASVTASFGVADTNAGALLPNQLLQQADAALYQAKDNGRNLVVVWHSDLARNRTSFTEREVPNPV
jgi:diguanylate cyclase (GGDEF)-like protein/PAS domain S-box-containing protein